MFVHPSGKNLTATFSHCLINVAIKGSNKPTEQRRTTDELENSKALIHITQIKTNAAHVTPLTQEMTVPFIMHVVLKSGIG
jgi:hypothetical protein